MVLQQRPWHIPQEALSLLSPGRGIILGKTVAFCKGYSKRGTNHDPSSDKQQLEKGEFCSRRQDLCISTSVLISSLVVRTNYTCGEPFTVICTLLNAWCTELLSSLTKFWKPICLKNLNNNYIFYSKITLTNFNCYYGWVTKYFPLNIRQTSTNWKITNSSLYGMPNDLKHQHQRYKLFLYCSHTFQSCFIDTDSFVGFQNHFYSFIEIQVQNLIGISGLVGYL